MMRLIKKYKNRRLYDTHLSAYITIEQVQTYVLSNVDFRVEDAKTGADLTNLVLLQIIMDMDAQATQFFSTALLKHLIQFAHHPMSVSLKQAMESIMQALQDSNTQKATEQWHTMMQHSLQHWDKLFK
ncbi:MAG: polyhydroxyalkanoate biosynthesis repressor PhaR [Legionella sp.]|nr:MAG: polyhydroxyalkanoate biosynthesis repressor PhaR [Legionella sp.]PJD99942.1 MAG: polyhydroxyalkanoate biosynthesis repressor PhaR [Legionella sp.]